MVSAACHYNLAVAKRVTKGNLWGFIQSRPYASVADIRRLFTTGVDDAAMLSTSEGTYFIGLPQEAADLIAQLWREGRIVLDTNPDVKALVVQGVYPARVMLGRQPAAQGSRQSRSSQPGQRTSTVRPPLPASGAAALESSPGAFAMGEGDEPGDDSEPARPSDSGP